MPLYQTLQSLLPTGRFCLLRRFIVYSFSFIVALILKVTCLRKLRLFGELHVKNHKRKTINHKLLNASTYS